MGQRNARILLAVVGAGLVVYSSWPGRSDVETQQPTPGAGSADRAAGFDLVLPARASPARASMDPGDTPRARDEEVGNVDARHAEEGPHGRVVEARTGSPIGGLLVRLRIGRKVLGEVETSTDGGFRLPPTKSQRVVEVLSDEWRVAPRRVRLDEEQATGAKELVFHVERIHASPIRGILIDERTGDPIPHFAIQARGPYRRAEKPKATGEDGEHIDFFRPAKRESFATDSHGRFVTTQAFEAGTIRFTLVGAEEEQDVSLVAPDRILLEHAVSSAGRLTLETEIGPTYRLGLGLPPDREPGDLYAVLESSAVPPTKRLRQGAFGFSGRPRYRQQEYRAPVRGEGPYWIRFRDRILDPALFDTADFKLVVRSKDGFWSGSRDVEAATGESDVGPIQLEPRGVVEGRVLSGEDPVSSAEVRLLSRFSDSAERVTTNSKGGFEFAWLQPGIYEVAAQSAYHEELRRSVNVSAGSIERISLQLDRPVTRGAVSGRLRGRNSRRPSALGGQLTLRHTGIPELTFKTRACGVHVDGEFVSQFAFEDVPVGTYELSLHPWDSFAWEALSQRITAPMDGLEFVRIDDVPTYRLETSARDAVTGERIELLRFLVWGGGDPDGLRRLRPRGKNAYEGLPVGLPLRWVARAKGYRLAEGDESAMAGTGATRRIDAELVPGWGQVFKITTDNGAPLQGVVLMADGVKAGESDAGGTLLLNVAAKPVQLKFLLQGHRVTMGRVDPSEPGFGAMGETRVHMGPIAAAVRSVR